MRGIAGNLSPNAEPMPATVRMGRGGHLLVTTPNVARIGNVFKLLIGRSTFDRLMPVDYEHPEDEWRPHFREYTLAEVSDLFRRAGFQVVGRKPIDANGRDEREG